MKRPAAACSTAAPPATEPVKATWSTPSVRITSAVVACDMCTAWRSPSGSPAAFAASSIRSAQSGVWCECLRTTALPAMSAGTTALTAVR